MIVLKLTLVRSTEGTLTSERVNEVKLSADDYSSCSFLDLLDCKRTVIVVEVLTVATEHERENPLLQSFIFRCVVAPVHEKILSP